MGGGEVEGNWPLGGSVGSSSRTETWRMEGWKIKVFLYQGQVMTVKGLVLDGGEG